MQPFDVDRRIASCSSRKFLSDRLENQLHRELNTVCCMHKIDQPDECLEIFWKSFDLRGKCDLISSNFNGSIYCFPRYYQQ